jgi:hypothetical protein
MKDPSADRVRAHTAPIVNRRLDEAAMQRVARYSTASEAEITRRIEELDREWDMERVLEMNASALALSGVVSSVVSNRKWLILPSVVLPFLFLHAVQGWCPPLPVLRRLGFRTRKEIDAEKYALKAMRGDFRNVTAESGTAALVAARQ